MPRKKKPTSMINRVISSSSRARWEYWREKGIPLDLGGHTLFKQELDDYTDEHIWRELHPGEEPIVKVVL